MKGAVVCLYAFDVAAEIRTASVRELLKEKPFPFQIRVGAAAPRDVRIFQPLTIGLKPDELPGGLPLKCVVKVFDVGVISIAFEIPFEGKGFDDLLAYHRLPGLDQRAEALCAQLVKELAAHLAKPNLEKAPVEAYTVFCLQAIPGVEPGAVPAWARSREREIAALLVEEAVPGRLSQDQVRETFRHSLSYSSNDFAVVDWDAALVADQSGYCEDVVYTIELANLQLVEFRLLDDRLDRFFLHAYDDLEALSARSRFLALPQKTLRDLRTFRMDIAKMSEEVSNITKFVGDWYLARVYLAAKDRFHLAHWGTSIDRKLAQLDGLYRLVQSDINERRMLVLEVLIVLLFLIDVAALFLLKK